MSLFYSWTLNNDTDEELVLSLATNYKLAGPLARLRSRVGGLWTSPAGLSRPQDGPREASSIGTQSTTYYGTFVPYYYSIITMEHVCSTLGTDSLCRDAARRIHYKVVRSNKEYSASQQL